ncbi:MAG: HAD-IA family hydrolase [Xanthomonadales bacterium]|nr:HAD-IA family hydrolase [Gammaproteobacteria bacterium]MBT8050573.1 HAD-IA family hydrolase [Gammaproteobacteria bacterium]NNJ80068.1 HAD-IA family hydrolase [Xanthomonadales bacterium]NNL04531.1 HAD-IA family hydrolase [Xanthomonadales bacterium]
MAAIKAMLFDLDGTLIDSAPDMVTSLNHVRGEAGLHPLPVDEVGHAVTRGAPGLLTVGMPKTDGETFESWRCALLDHYARSGFPLTRFYDGISELLDALEARGLPWGIVTNKIESLTHPFIRARGLGDRVSAVVCGDTLPVSKPHPEPVWLACEQLGCKPEEVLFVGDDQRDLEAGEAAGTQLAAVHYGYGSRGLNGPLLERSYAVHHPSDLHRLLT